MGDTEREFCLDLGIRIIMGWGGTEPVLIRTIKSIVARRSRRLQTHAVVPFSMLARASEQLSLVGLLAMGLLATGCSRQPEDGSQSAPAAAPPPASYVGSTTCAGCHSDETAAWRGSHHALAMQDAVPGTVLGDFNDARFTHNDVTSRFFTQDGRYWVQTDNGKGALQDYPIAYTFGVDPLQQYLIRLDGGRYQALSIAWDTRPANRGGQRWFHLYPDETFTPEDPLHWTGHLNNWNFMCAECHSTDLDKNYQSEADGYQTEFAEINVACEACHGPGSRHLAWVRRPTENRGGEAGFSITFSGGDAVPWVFDDQSGIARRAVERTDTVMLDVCGRCHARRGQFAEEAAESGALLDSYRPALLDEGLYQADGQIQDEVYVYGSFLQSAMHQAGVVCTDCHDAHSAGLKAEGNDVCAQCHLPDVFDSAGHHHHEAGSDAAQCVNCHMPARTYMVVDPRRDHSFRVPRPDLSSTIGTANACSQCHTEQSNEWAAAAIETWYPDTRSESFHYGEALHAGRTWAADAAPLLQRLTGDPSQPGIIRATALSLLARQLDDSALSEAERLLEDRDPLVRLAAVNALAGVEPGLRLRLLRGHLTDEVRAVRMDTARALAGAVENLGQRRREQFDGALAEYRAAQAFTADRAEGLFNLATLAAQQGRARDAERLYRAALDRQAGFFPAMINLADLYRGTGQDTRAEALLGEAVAANPDNGALQHAHGLSLVRENRAEEGLAALRRAVDLVPEEPRYTYVLGVALFPEQPQEALNLLRQAQEKYPGRHDLLLALATMSRDLGDFPGARRYAQQLATVSPTHPAAQQLLSTLPNP